MNNTARLSRLARKATARARAVYAAAAGYLPREYRLSRINAAEGATNVCIIENGVRVRLTASPARYVAAQRVAARPVQTLPRG